MRVKWLRWGIVNPGERNDFLPIVIGGIILFYSLPAFLMVLLMPDRNSGVIGVPLLIVLGGGIVIGAIFVTLGIRVCSDPGSLAYRISHGRFFWR